MIQLKKTPKYVSKDCQFAQSADVNIFEHNHLTQIIVYRVIVCIIAL